MLNVTVPVSAGRLDDTTSYFDALTAYRVGKPSTIVQRLAGASFEVTTNGRQLVAALRRHNADSVSAMRYGLRQGPAIVPCEMFGRLTVLAASRARGDRLRMPPCATPGASMASLACLGPS